MKLATGVSTVGWGLYCASSWTWCIGMFLPVLMLQRHGWPGFIVFAVPNVLGCAAFGYVLRQRDRAAALSLSHARAMRLFSLATIAFHIYFIGFVCWLLLPLPREFSPWVAVAAPPALLSLAALLSRMPRRAWPWFAGAVYLVSLAVFAQIGVEPLREIPWTGDHAPGELAWLALPLFFGFALCPYLDLTFHRALQSSPSRHAFGVFGVAFAVMIVLTCAYWNVLTAGLTWLITSHLAVQSLFTVAAHLHELRSAPGTTDRRAGAEALATLMALPLVFGGAFTLDPLATSLDVYIRFLALYGLLFPAYALLFMGPRPLERSRRNIIVYGVLMLAFLPMYEIAFLHGRAWAAAAAVVALLALARLWRPSSAIDASVMPRSAVRR